MIAGALWLVTISTILGALLSTLHYALRDYNVIKLQTLIAARGGSHLLERVLADVPGHVLSTAFLRSLCNVAITVGSVLMFDVLRIAAPAADVPPDVDLNWAGLVAASILASALIYFFGIVIPMSVAEHAGERVIAASAGLLAVTHTLALPLRALGGIDTAIRRLAGAEHVTDQEQIQEDIIAVAAEAEREGTIHESERNMLEAVVSFRSRTVEEIMTPRTEIEGFELTDDVAFIQRFIQEHGHSRIPVYQGDLDHIVGILYAKDLIRYIGTDASKFKLRPILRRPVWVPETKPLAELLYELRARKVHIAIVLDEYGGTTGLVTFEDLLEEIVGEIQDEYEPLSESLPDIEVDAGSRSAEIEARAYIADVNAALTALGFEVPESEDYDTIGGYVLSRLGHIPLAGESFDRDGFLVTILAAEPTRVVKLRIEAPALLEPQTLPEPEPSAQEVERASAVIPPNVA